MVASSHRMTSIISESLLVAIGVQLACQVYKMFEGLIRNDKAGWRKLFSTGGMPSSHSAFVASLTTAMAINAGLDSELFAISCVFSLIAVYDTVRVRGAILRNLEALRHIMESIPKAKRPINSPTLAHTPVEIVTGLLLGISFPIALNGLGFL